MKKIIYVAQRGDAHSSFMKVCQDVYGQQVPQQIVDRYRSLLSGEIMYIGDHRDGQPVYWVYVNRSFTICRQAWADFLALFGDCISEWKIVEHD